MYKKFSIILCFITSICALPFSQKSSVGKVFESTALKLVQGVGSFSIGYISSFLKSPFYIRDYADIFPSSVQELGLRRFLPLCLHELLAKIKLESKCILFPQSFFWSNFIQIIHSKEDACAHGYALLSSANREELILLFEDTPLKEWLLSGVVYKNKKELFCLSLLALSRIILKEAAVKSLRHIIKPANFKKTFLYISLASVFDYLIDQVTGYATLYFADMQPLKKPNRTYPFDIFRYVYDLSDELPTDLVPKRIVYSAYHLECALNVLLHMFNL